MPDASVFCQSLSNGFFAPNATGRSTTSFPSSRRSSATVFSEAGSPDPRDRYCGLNWLILWLEHKRSGECVSSDQKVHSPQPPATTSEGKRGGFSPFL